MSVPTCRVSLISVAWSDFRSTCTSTPTWVRSYSSPSQSGGRGLPQWQHFYQSHLYTWVERGPVSVKSLAHELNAQLPARARTQTTRSWGWTNHDALAPPLKRIHVIRLITHLRHVAKARLALRCTNWMGNPLKVCPSGIALLMACWNSSFPAETPVLCSSS